MPSKKKTEKTTDLAHERTEDFISTYANNAYFESSVWDLKIVFGPLDQPIGSPAIVRQTIAVALPWAQAKLRAYFIRLHVEANDIQNGKVPIRPDLLPPPPPPLTEEQANDPNAKKLFELVTKLRAEFVANS
jgi:hypothetical protein